MIAYMEMLENLFRHFGIECRMKHIPRLCKINVVFEPDRENLLRYADMIYYAYNEEKRRMSNPLIENLKTQQFRISSMTDADTDADTDDDYYTTATKGSVSVAVSIHSIVEIEPEMVYDFTTRSENHSFVASSFVVSNCPAETPEGQSIGIVKNISYMAHITIPSNSASLYEYVAPFLQKIETLSTRDLYKKTKVFVNGSWLGITHTPFELYTDMKEKKYKGIINIYASIVFDYKLNEIRICNDAGRITRPVLRVRDNKALITADIIRRLENHELTWNDLLTNCVLDEAVIEYIDPEEQNWAMIGMMCKGQYIHSGGVGANTDAHPQNEHTAYTHCEIHPSTIFGVLSSCIPFPEHNQAPRNTYQCAMSKQSIGVYAKNYDQRMDKTAYVLNYPSRP
jgi:hypothetical protein